MSSSRYQRPLEEVLSALGIDADLVPAIADQDETLLPSRLPVMDCAISSVAACLAAATDLAMARTGRQPETTLDPSHVAAAMRSEFWLRDPAGKGISGFAPLSRLWPTTDGWVRTHANYPWHRSALLKAFGVPDGQDSEIAQTLGAVFARRVASDIEEHAYASGALTVAARSIEKWRTSAPGSAVETSPLIAIDDLGRHSTPLGGPGPLPAPGVRVLDLTRVIAGPVGTRMLAALGADVLRLDPPHRPELPLHAVDGIVGKTSAAVDLSTALGQTALHKLLQQADVVIAGYRPGALRPFGLESDQIAERHPHLIVVTLSAWGPGPWQYRRGFDSLVQVASGISQAASSDGDRPGALPCQLLDHATGYLIAAGTLAALARRARTGQVTHLHLSLARTAKWLLDQPQPVPEYSKGPTQTEEEVAPYRVSTGNGWSAIAPPGTLDGRPLAWPRLPPRYAASPPTWAQPHN